MVKNSSGFTLIELVFGLLISALLVTMLYACLYQLQRAAHIADDLLSLDMRVLILKNQLSRDLAGAFMPKSTAENQKYFLGESNDGNLQLLTFISMNPLRTAIETNPKIVRVRYQVSNVLAQPDTFKIQRTESEILTYSALKNARAYTVIDDVKALKVVYFMPEEKPIKKVHSDKAEKTGKSGKTIVDKSELLKVNFTAKQAGEFKNLPAYIKFSLELWDNKEHIGSTSYELDLPIYTYQKIIQAKEKNEIEKDNSEKNSEKNSDESKNNSETEKIV